MQRSPLIVIANVTVLLILSGALVGLAAVSLGQRSRIRAQDDLLVELKSELVSLQSTIAGQQTQNAVPARRTEGITDGDDESTPDDDTEVMLRHEIIDLQTQFQSLVARLTNLERTIEQDKQRRSPRTLTSDQDDDRVRLEAMQRSIDELQTRVNQQERTTGQAEWSQLESRIDRLADDTREHSQKLDRLESTLRGVELEGDRGDLPRMVRDFGRRLESLESSVRSIEGDRDRVSLQRSIDRLDSELNSVDREVRDLSSRVRRLESDR